MDVDQRNKHCEGLSNGDSCIINCQPGYNENPDEIICSIDSEGKTEWKTREGELIRDLNKICQKESLFEDTVRYSIFCLSSRKDVSSNNALLKSRVTSYCTKYDKIHVKPYWTLAYNDEANYNIRFSRAEVTKYRSGNFETTDKKLWESCSLLGLPIRYRQSSYFKRFDAGFNNGHLVPLQSMKFNFKAALSTFLYSNAEKQNREINGGSWNELETKVVDFGRDKKMFILTGICPVKSSTEISRCFWKLICAKIENRETAIGFYQDNFNTAARYSLHSQKELMDKIFKKDAYAEKEFMEYGWDQSLANVAKKNRNGEHLAPDVSKCKSSQLSPAETEHFKLKFSSY